MIKRVKTLKNTIASASAFKTPKTSLSKKGFISWATSGIAEKISYRGYKSKSLAGWREIGGVKYYMRSRWESNYGKYLQWLKTQKLIKDWAHEPDTFWFDKIKRGVRSYLPDYKILNNDGTHHYVEVKGWMDPKSATKIKRFAKYYPEEVLIVVNEKWFAKNNGKMRILIKDWEK